MRNHYLLGLGGALLATTSLALAAHFFPGAVASVQHFAAANGMGLMGFGLAGTTLGADKYRQYEQGDQNHVGCIATDIVYEGAAVGDNASGYGRPLVAGDRFLGFALQQCDNSTGSAGDKNILMRTNGEIELTIASVALTDVGKAVYASDDDTFTYTDTSNSFIGRVKRYVSATRAVVEFDATRAGFGMVSTITQVAPGGTTATPNNTNISTIINTISSFSIDNQSLANIIADLNTLKQMVNK